MSALGSRIVARSVVTLRPLPAVQRGLRTSSAFRQADPHPYEAKEPKPRGDQNKLLALGAVAVGVGFWWFYRGGKPTPATESSGEKAASK
ncbi:hypothetical protein CEP51_012416 [Fusarium floridanum]|uniref:Uncharacterized protein n=1 Tax=Fusarium floridanum TaxID=1325733 RepID=A0A428QU91_9HYPO|nr:hypothetical protein CEP51_012416 [Fusarium floridanum]